MPNDQDRLTGKTSFILLGNDADVELPITKFKHKIKRSFQDDTDSTFYDKDTAFLYPTRIQVALSLEAEIEGFFRYSVVPRYIIQELFDGENALAMEFYIEEGQKIFAGVFDIGDFEMSTPVMDFVEYSMTVKSYGVFTSGASSG